MILNLVKNAAEAIDGAPDGDIVMTTGFKPGVRLSVPGSASRVSLPIEVCIKDNGPGFAPDPGALPLSQIRLRHHQADRQRVIGLARLAAKIVGDHGGIVECESQNRRTRSFRNSFSPMYLGHDA